MPFRSKVLIVFYSSGQNHDAFVGWAATRGVPDLLANIPSMVPLYIYSVGQEVLRSLNIIDQPQEQICE